MLCYTKLDDDKILSLFLSSNEEKRKLPVNEDNDKDI